MKITKESVVKFLIATIFIASVILIIYGIFSSETTKVNTINNRFEKISVDWRMTIDDSAEKLVKLPYRLNGKSGTIVRLTTLLPFNIQNNEELFFKSNHQCVRVYVENKLIYEFGYNDNRKFGKTPGDALILVDLDSSMSGKHCTVELYNVYDSSVSRSANNIYIGDRNSISTYILQKNLVALCLCTILLLLGIFMAICCLFVKNSVVVTLKRLSIFSILLSLWSVFLTDVFQLVWRNPYQCHNMEYLIFSCLAPAFIWFLLSLKQYENDRVLKVMMKMLIVDVAFVNTLQYFNIMDYVESVMVTHILIGIFTAYMGYTAIKDYLKSKQKSLVSLLATVILIISACIDMVRFYFTQFMDEGFFIRLGFFIFIMIWSVKSLKLISEYYILRAEKEIMEKLAYVDVMTGLQNRNSYMREADLYRSGDITEDTCMVLIDMNNLKKINDTYGHDMGDVALTMVGKVLKEVLFKEVKCYRIGGDEFIYLIKKYNIDDVRRKMDNLAQEVISRCKGKPFECSIAYGISIICKSNNYDIDTAYRKADEEMYAYKKKFKERNGR